MASALSPLPVNEASPLALYVHWPFCVSKCPYCDFNSHVRSSIDQQAWRDALLADLAYEAALLPGRSLGSIFFGGGTPSLMDPATVAAVIEAAQRHWPATSDLEITLEANPSSVEAANFADLAAAGVNRVSLGLQSLDDDALRFLGRAHDTKEALAALDTAQRHFGRVSIDLIYALPGQTADQWQAMLTRALGFGTGHLSLYQLTIEPGTKFAALHAAGRFTPLDEDSAAGLFELTAEMTDAASRPAYEISNHAVPGQESRHNLTYWRYGDYAGIGPGAHGRRNGLRTVRHKKPENFLAALARNGHGMVEEEPLSSEESAHEALVMGLRLAEGIDPAALQRRFGRPLIDAAAAFRLAQLRLLDQSPERLRVTPAGRLVLDRILAEVAA
ncbi:radical SAM family heme chaperone HemW [Sphingomonas sp. KRR8]|uniref:radical SAM family heme chaperone HemW n=1 Tax=Sphingomonas sp. KRR8 TaxID=2942996 RepID=UPI0020218600|nr:radical SAM family heme chaperone HemW [Sphingomonas sp. KRR8]URD62163.1 radical SAM family heme chaperone HemW [Sphingomonas sp. KRR8]